MDQATRQPAPKLRNAAVDYCFEESLLLLGCGTSTVRIIPPLNVEDPLIDEALIIFEHALARAEEDYL
jgi:4-aminobutyrate aminotransferase